MKPHYGSTCSECLFATWSSGPGHVSRAGPLGKHSVMIGISEEEPSRAPKRGRMEPNLPATLQRMISTQRNVSGSCTPPGKASSVGGISGGKMKSRKKKKKHYHRCHCSVSKKCLHGDKMQRYKSEGNYYCKCFAAPASNFTRARLARFACTLLQGQGCILSDRRTRQTDAACGRAGPLSQAGVTASVAPCESTVRVRVTRQGRGQRRSVRGTPPWHRGQKAAI